MKGVRCKFDDSSCAHREHTSAMAIYRTALRAHNSFPPCCIAAWFNLPHISFALCLPRALLCCFLARQARDCISCNLAQFERKNAARCVLRAGAAPAAARHVGVRMMQMDAQTNRHCINQGTNLTHELALRGVSENNCTINAAYCVYQSLLRAFLKYNETRISIIISNVLQRIKWGIIS